MPNQEITSLHSPQVERVKALLHSRGKKVRRETGEFVVDSAQVILAALQNPMILNSSVKTLFATTSGLERLNNANVLVPEDLDFYEVSDSVMAEMSEVETSQGLLMICSIEEPNLESLLKSAKKLIFFWQMQDPGNAGTVIRSADASGFEGVLLSNESVDLFSPKVIRSTVGSIWSIPVLNNVDLNLLLERAKKEGFEVYALDSHGSKDISEISSSKKVLLIFGNEARGLPDLPTDVVQVSIPMQGNTESFNVASAATIAMYEVALRKR